MSTVPLDNKTSVSNRGRLSDASSTAPFENLATLWDGWLRRQCSAKMLQLCLKLEFADKCIFTSEKGSILTSASNSSVWLQNYVGNGLFQPFRWCGDRKRVIFEACRLPVFLIAKHCGASLRSLGVGASSNKIRFQLPVKTVKWQIRLADLYRQTVPNSWSGSRKCTIAETWTGARNWTRETVRRQKMMTTTGGGSELAIVRQILWCQVVESIEDHDSELKFHPLSHW